MQLNCVLAAIFLLVVCANLHLYGVAGHSIQDPILAPRVPASSLTRQARPKTTSTSPERSKQVLDKLKTAMQRPRQTEPKVKPVHSPKPSMIDSSASAFDLFISKYGREYTKGSAEYKTRFENFKQNIGIINEFNKKSGGAAPVVLAITSLTDKSMKEITDKFPGKKIEANAEPATPTRAATTHRAGGNSSFADVTSDASAGNIVKSAAAHWIADAAQRDIVVAQVFGFVQSQQTQVGGIDDIDAHRTPVSIDGNGMAIRTYNSMFWRSPTMVDHNRGVSWVTMLPRTTQQLDKDTCVAHSEIAVLGHALIRAFNEDVKSKPNILATSYAHWMLHNMLVRNAPGSYHSKTFPLSVSDGHPLKTHEYRFFQPEHDDRSSVFRQSQLDLATSVPAFCAHDESLNCISNSVSNVACSFLYAQAVGIAPKFLEFPYRRSMEQGTAQRTDICDHYRKAIGGTTNNDGNIISGGSKLGSTSSIWKIERSEIEQLESTATLPQFKNVQGKVQFMALILNKSPFVTDIVMTHADMFMTSHYAGGVISNEHNNLILQVMKTHGIDPSRNHHEVAVVGAGMFLQTHGNSKTIYFRVRDSNGAENTNGYYDINVSEPGLLPFNLCYSALAFAEVKINEHMATVLG